MVNTVIDTALTALVQILTTNMANIDPDVQVLDGPSIDDVGRDVIAIGMTAESTSTDATERIAGLAVVHETFDVECLVRSWNGDHDLSSRRHRAFQILDEVMGIVHDDNTLGGAVTRARLARTDYHPSRIPEGAVASVTFRIRIEAFTS